MTTNHANWCPGPKKAFETLCYLALHGVDHPIRAAHTVFEADRISLERYGRPIYGEHWNAGWYGPQPAVMGALLTRDPFAVSMLDPEDAAHLTALAPTEILRSLRRPNTDLLSVSDVECLMAGTAICSGRSEREAIQVMSRDPVVVAAQGGVIWPRMLAPREWDKRRIADLESAMSYIYFGN